MNSAPSEALPADLRVALDQFEAAAEACFLPYQQALDAQPSPKIFHYTSDGGLEGILSTGTIRLTDAFALNDPTEITYGLDVLDRLFSNELAKGAPPELGVFRERLKLFVQSGGVSAAAHYFVGSFSVLGDDLPQWRSYADDGRGFALEFESGCLEQAFTQPSAGSFNTATFPVNYDVAETERLYRPLIELGVPLISLPHTRKMSGDEINKYFQELEVNFALAAIRRSVFFKHHGYLSEKEYRILQIHQSIPGAPVPVGIRWRGGEPVRFRTLDWKKQVPAALKAIVIGPSSIGRRDIRVRTRELLDAAGLHHVPIRDSSLPYRVFGSN